MRSAVHTNLPHSHLIPVQVDRINELFVEARDEIEYAKEDAETVCVADKCLPTSCR